LRLTDIVVTDYVIDYQFVGNNRCLNSQHQHHYVSQWSLHRRSVGINDWSAEQCHLCPLCTLVHRVPCLCIFLLIGVMLKYAGEAGWHRVGSGYELWFL